MFPPTRARPWASPRASRSRACPTPKRARRNRDTSSHSKNIIFPSTTTMISGAASDRARDARAVRPVAGVDRRRPRGIRVGGTFSRLAPAFVALAHRDRPAHPPTPPATFPAVSKHKRDRRHVRRRRERHDPRRARPQGGRCQAPRLRLRGPTRRPQGPRRRYALHPSPRTAAPGETTRSRFVPPREQIQIHARRRREATTSISLDFEPTSRYNTDLPSTRPPLNSAPKARAASFTVRAASQTEDLNKKLQEVTATVSEKWDDTEEKPAVVTLGIFG